MTALTPSDKESLANDSSPVSGEASASLRSNDLNWQLSQIGERGAAGPAKGCGGQGVLLCVHAIVLAWSYPAAWKRRRGSAKKKSDLASEATNPTEGRHTDNLEWKIRIFMPYVVFSICFLTNINVDSGKQARNSLGTSQFPKHHQPCLAKSRKRDIKGLLKG